MLPSSTTVYSFVPFQEPPRALVSIDVMDLRLG